MISVFEAHKPKQQQPVQKPAQHTIIDDITKWQKTGDRDLQTKILEAMQPTIKSALHSFAPGKQDAFAIQAAKLTLSSLQSFDPAKKINPNTFVYHNLQRLNRIRRQRQNIIHIPQNIVYEQSLVDKKSKQLQDTLGRQATLNQLADATGLSMKRLIKLQDTSGISTINDSSAVNQSGQQTFGTSNITDQDVAKYVYSSVDPVNQKIMQWSTPYFGKKELSGQQIAKRLRLSTGAVSQRKAQISNMLAQVRGLMQ